MKAFLKRRGSLALGVLLAAASAHAQVLRVDMTTPSNESSVPFSAAGGQQATAFASIIPAGQIATINVTAGGSGYTFAPSVSVTGTGTGAFGAAVLSFKVGAITVSSFGSGYTSVPTVTFSGGGGTGAAATAIVNLASGQVTGYTITSAGSGYASAPTITVTGGGGAGASAFCVMDGSVQSVTVSVPGSGYTGTPTVVFSGGGGTGATATTTLTTGTVAGITMSNRGVAYTNPPTVTISGGGGSGAIGTAVVANGIVTGVNITNPGSGYVTAPTVTINPPDGVVLMTARVTGTDAKYTTKFFVNGKQVSLALEHFSTFPEVTAAWTPPQPGSYFLTAATVDSVGNSALSLPVRIFVTGSQVLSPIGNTLVPLGSSIVISGDATVAQGFIKTMEFFVNGVSVGVDGTAPYSMPYAPPAAGTYSIVVKGTDNNNNVATSAPVVVTVVSPVGAPPVTKILNPIDNSSVASGSAVNIIADATDSDGFINKVEFYVNGVLLNSATAFPFTASWTPTTPGRYQLVALGFDDKGNVGASTPTTVTVTGGFPTISITSPTAASSAFVQGVKVPVSVTAGGADGGITSLRQIEFLVDGNINDALPKNPQNLVPPPPLTQPFVFTWQSNVSLGTHRLSARVTDVNGLTITSVEVPVTVVANQLPTISITNPAAGTSLAPNTAVTISASAADTDGSVDSVEFFANGVAVGNPVKSSPYQVSWTPTAAGPYTLTAKVTDNAGGVVTSSEVGVTVEITTATNTGTIGGGGTNTVYRGDYGSPSESGHFTLAVNRNSRGTFIGYSSQPTGRTYFWTDFAVSGDGTFAVRDATGTVVFSGQTSATGVAGTFGGKTFIGPITQGSAVFQPLIFLGTLDGNAASTVIAIVGGDGTVTLYIAAGSNREVGSDFLTTTGAYNFASATGGRFTGTVTASTAIVSGTVSGTVTGTFLLKQQPGRLINLSTRALAGTGDQTMVSGFVVRGTGSKPLLLRAVGPTLVNFGVPAPLNDPTLAVVSGAGATVASNNDWGNNAALATAAAQAGAFALNASSRDAALITTLSPGMYTAVIGGSSTIAGNVLVEIYDTDTSATPTARIGNISTRAQVTPGETLLAGFVITGDLKKKLLLRAVGPTLASFGMTGVLADPKLELLVGTTTAATNNDWSSGNAAAIAQLSASSAAVGAFPLLAGSKDSSLIVQLNPGAYTVQVTGVGSSSGVVLIEIYDADP